MIILIDTVKAFPKIQHPFLIKTLRKQEIEENFSNLRKVIQKTPTVNIILNGERREYSPPGLPWWRSG